MKKSIAALLTFLAAVNLASLEWPSSFLNAVSVFGQKVDSTVQRGIVLTQTEEIRASGDGEVLFVMEESSNLSGFPGTLGNTVLIAHEDSLISVYGNLENLLRVSDAIQIDSGAILGAAKKNPGMNSGDCYFQVYDTERKNLLNPQMLLPSIPDSKAPVIRNVSAVSVANGQIYQLGTIKTLKQGKYRIVAEISDTVNSGNAELGIFRASVLVNGAETASVPFELFKEKGGKLSVGTDIDGAVLYADDARLNLGEIRISRGRADITVVARDIAGNERSVLFGLTVE